MNVANPALLKSNSIVLRELESSDVTELYVHWLNDPNINKYLESRFILQDKHTVKNFVDNCRFSEFSFLFGMFLPENMKHIGNIKLGSINKHHKSAEVGLVIGDKSYWNKGFASIVISMVTQFAFNELKLTKLNAGCYESNIGSKKSFEKSGYQVEGFLRDQVDSDNGREGIWNLGCINQNTTI
jgi:[ribosomal protein S5]-alanine N-acetyltransferase